MPISTPQQQAGILSFYDAPEHGPVINPRLFIIAVVIFVLLIVIFDHSALFQ